MRIGVTSTIGSRSVRPDGFHNDLAVRYGYDSVGDGGRTLAGVVDVHRHESFVEGNSEIAYAGRTTPVGQLAASASSAAIDLDHRRQGTNHRTKLTLA